jgi:hypothetical protein
MTTLLHLSPDGPRYWSRNRTGWQPLDQPPAPSEEPVWVVTDLAEESLVEIDIPRLWGSNRTALIERQLATRFPDTPYRLRLPIEHGQTFAERLTPTHHTLFGISADKINAELDSRNLQVAGLCASTQLLTHIGSQRKLPNELFVILPGPSWLRVVFIRNRVPLLTRLAPTADAAAQAEEIIRTHRYLENNRILQRGTQPPPVLILGASHALAAPLAAARLTLIAPPAPWQAQPPGDWQTALFDLAIRQQPYGQLAPTQRRIVYLARKTQRAALITAGLCLLTGGLAAAGNLQSLISARTQIATARTTLQQLDGNLAELDQRISRFGVAPDLMRRAVALERDEIIRAPQIQPHLQLLGQAIDGDSGLRLSSLEWQLLAAHTPPCTRHLTDAASTTDKPSGDASPPPSEEATRTDTSPAPKVELAFELLLPGSVGPRTRAQLLRQLSARLAALPGATIYLDPAAQLTRGTLRGGALLAGEENKNFTWCMTLAGAQPTPGTDTQPNPLPSTLSQERP